MRRVLVYGAILTLFLAAGCGDDPTGNPGQADAQSDRMQADAAPDTGPDPCDACVPEAACAAGACTCPAGYAGDGTTAGTGCTNVNECGQVGLNECVAAAAGGTCTDVDGSYTCGCQDGYVGDGTTTGTGCTNVDECDDPGQNDCVAAAAGGTCTDTAGSYTCGCQGGYSGDGTTSGTGCTNVIECGDPGLNDCVAAAAGGTCTDVVGSYTCGCQDGYVGDGTTSGTGCTNVNECNDPGQNDCVAAAAGGTCTDTVGSYSCGCLGGYVGDGTTSGTGCTNVNECNDPGLNNCVAAAAGGTCTDVVGSYTCGCLGGYSGDGTTSGTGCTNVDECNDPGLNNCVAAAAGGACTDTVGSYTCGCQVGYTGDGITSGTGCTDVDECAGGTHDCGWDQCRNTVGSFECHALFGTSPFQSLIMRIDPATGTALWGMPFPAVAGYAGTVVGVNGIKTHPVSGTMFHITKILGVSGRVLAALDPVTMTSTGVGNLGDNFSSLTFNADGSILWGVTGDGASVPETLYTIDQATAAKTLVRALGNGADGEVIEFNPLDGQIYHWSGNGTVVFEKIEAVSPWTVTNVPVVGTTNGETFGAVFNPLTGRFLISNISSSMNDVNPNGTWGAGYGFLPDDLRGLAFNKYVRRHNISPASGPAAGGNTVTFRGFNIGAAGVPDIRFGVVNDAGGVSATDVTVIDAHTITATAPAGTGTVSAQMGLLWNAATALAARWVYTYLP